MLSDRRIFLTFCLLSAVGTWRTKKPSLRELTEMPAEREREREIQGKYRG